MVGRTGQGAVEDTSVGSHVLVRSTLMTITGLAVGRCFSILLEKHRIAFSEIRRLFTFSLGPWEKSMDQIGCAFILIFFFTAQISAPELN